MDIAVNNTLSVCPQFTDATNNLVGLYTNLTFNKSDQLAAVACEAERLKFLNLWVWNQVSKKIYIISFFIGTIGNILALSAYVTIEEFQATAFYYYRAINVFDLIYLVDSMCTGFDLYDFSSTARFGLDIFVWAIIKIAGKSARLLVTWLAFDRSVACHLPKHYAQIDSKRTAIGAIVCCVLLAVLNNAADIYYDVLVHIYGGVRPDFPLAIFDRVFRGVEGLLMLILMPIVLAGFIQMSRRKRRLVGNGHVTSKSDKAMLLKININKWLCILQLCEGVPQILNTVVIYVSYVANFSGLIRNGNSYLINATYEENVSYQKLFEIQQYFVILVTLIDAYNHSGHFYTYFLCSPKFRRAIINVVKRKFGNRVESTTVGFL